MRPVPTAGLELLKAANCFLRVSPLAKLYLEHGTFETPGYLSELYHFPLSRNSSVCSIAHELDARWLLRPEPLAALRFAKEHPVEDQWCEWIGTPFLFLHEPWESPRGLITLGLHAGVIRCGNKKLPGWELVVHSADVGATRGVRVVGRMRQL